MHRGKDKGGGLGGAGEAKMYEVHGDNGEMVEGGGVNWEKCGERVKGLFFFFFCFFLFFFVFFFVFCFCFVFVCFLFW